MTKSLALRTLLACLLTVALFPLHAAADEDSIATRVSLLLGFPDEDDAKPNGALVVPGTVIPVDVEGGSAFQYADKDSQRTLDLTALGRRLKATLRLARFEVAYSTDTQMEVGIARDLPGPGGDSEISVQIQLLGFTKGTASYQVQFFERSAIIADTPVAVARGKRAVVGGLDGKTAPYFFLVVEPATGHSGNGPYDLAKPLHVGGDVIPPRAIHKAPPQYTEEARKERLQGVVIVQATIDQQGLIDDVKVLKGLGLGLEEAAVEAIRQWRFEPARLNGKPVAVYYNLTVNFRLDSDEDK